MTYTYTDQQLNELNHGKNVYSVNPEYAKRKENRTAIVTEKTNHKLKKGEVNTITTSAGQRFLRLALMAWQLHRLSMAGWIIRMWQWLQQGQILIVRQILWVPCRVM